MLIEPSRTTLLLLSLMVTSQLAALQSAESRRFRLTSDRTTIVRLRAHVVADCTRFDDRFLFPRKTETHCNSPHLRCILFATTQMVLSVFKHNIQGRFLYCWTYWNLFYSTNYVGRFLACFTIYAVYEMTKKLNANMFYLAKVYSFKKSWYIIVSIYCNNKYNLIWSLFYMCATLKTKKQHFTSVCYCTYHVVRGGLPTISEPNRRIVY